MLHRSLRRTGSAAAHDLPVSKNVQIIERSAPYTHSTSLGWVHVHKEMNFRPHAMGWRAYTSKYMDPFAPFSQTYPARHVETKFPGMWMGCGHLRVDEKNFGKFLWKWYLKGTWGQLAGCAYVFYGWWFRIGYVNNYAIRNKGAVSGM